MSRNLPMKLQIFMLKRWLRKNGYFEDDVGDIGALFDSLDSTFCYRENLGVIKKLVGESIKNKLKSAKYQDFLNKEHLLQIQHDMECDTIEYINELAFQILDEQSEQADIDLAEIQDFLDIKMLNGGILIRLNVRLKTFIKKSWAYFQSWLSFVIRIDKNTLSYG